MISFYIKPLTERLFRMLQIEISNSNPMDKSLSQEIIFCFWKASISDSVSKLIILS
ncbi:hypothetical protein MCEGKSE7_00037 [Candidatus Nanopelagicaceae bacterium]